MSRRLFVGPLRRGRCRRGVDHEHRGRPGCGARIARSARKLRSRGHDRQGIVPSPRSAQPAVLQRGTGAQPPLNDSPQRSRGQGAEISALALKQRSAGSNKQLTEHDIGRVGSAPIASSVAVVAPCGSLRVVVRRTKLRGRQGDLRRRPASGAGGRCRAAHAATGHRWDRGTPRAAASGGLRQETRVRLCSARVAKPGSAPLRYNGFRARRRMRRILDGCWSLAGFGGSLG